MPEQPPHPWRAEKDASTGAVYYWNTDTNETSWEFPKAAGGAPAPAGGGGGGGGGGAYAARDVFKHSDLGGSTGDPSDIAAWRKQHEVVVSAGCPDPILTFAAANLPPQLMSEVTRAGARATPPTRHGAGHGWRAPHALAREFGRNRACAALHALFGLVAARPPHLRPLAFARLRSRVFSVGIHTNPLPRPNLPPQASPTRRRSRARRGRWACSRATWSASPRPARARPSPS
jgi:hypothetical protein